MKKHGEGMEKLYKDDLVIQNMRDSKGHRRKLKKCVFQKTSRNSIPYRRIAITNEHVDEPNVVLILYFTTHKQIIFNIINL